MRSLFIFLCLPWILSADEKWLELRSGQFEVLTTAGDKAARTQMTQLEQFRHALGTSLGKPDLKLLWPLRILLSGHVSPRAKPSSIALARDSYILAVTETGGLPPDRLQELALLLIAQNTNRLPGEIERGLVDLFSTLQVSGTHLVLGTPPANRSRDWARMHLLSVDPAYTGRTRVMLSNLEQGAELATAYRNAFEKTEAQVEKQVDAYMAAGQYGTTTVSARAISAKDFHVNTADADVIKLAQADLLLATGSAQAEAAYAALHGPEAAEGLGLVALRANRKNEAKQLFESAVVSGSKSPRPWLEAATLEPDPAKAAKLFEKAGELNPRWAMPAFRWSTREADFDRRAILLKKAAALEPRNGEYWRILARNETDANRFVEAQKAWGGAERAAANREEREQIRQLRLNLQGQRADHEAAERKRKADEEAAELERLKNETMASIHEAESAANRKLNPNGAVPPKPVDWWNAPEGSAKVEGTLQRFDCLGSQARLVILTSESKTVQLLARDPSQMSITGAGEMTLSCGPQKPPRKVLVTYSPKADKKMGTAGEPVTIEFR